MVSLKHIAIFCGLAITITILSLPLSHAEVITCTFEDWNWEWQKCSERTVGDVWPYKIEMDKDYYYIHRKGDFLPPIPRTEGNHTFDLNYIGWDFEVEKALPGDVRNTISTKLLPNTGLKEFGYIPPTFLDSNGTEVDIYNDSLLVDKDFLWPLRVIGDGWILNSTETWNGTFNDTNTDINESLILDTDYEQYDYFSAYTMDDLSATEILDFNNSNNNDCLDVGTTNQVGQLNRSRYFDGSSSFLNCTNNEDFAPRTGNFTVAFKINTTSANDFPIANDQGGSGFDIYLSAAGIIRYQIEGSGPTTSTTSVATVNDGEWHCVVGVFDAVNNKITLFIDKTQTGVPGTNDPGDSNPVGRMIIGKHNAVGGLDFTGYLDEIIISKTNWSIQQIEDYCDGGSYSAGNFTSSLRDSGGASTSITNTSCTGVIPTGTSVNLYSNVSDDLTTWYLEQVGSGVTCDGTNYTITNQRRYYHAIAELKTTVAATPHITEIEVHEETVDVTAPTCVLVNQTPTDLNISSEGAFIANFICYDASGVNASRTVVGRSVNDSLGYFEAIRPPHHDDASYCPAFQSDIQKADGRADGKWYDDYNTPLGTGLVFADNYTYAAFDNSSTYVTYTHINDTAMQVTVDGSIVIEHVVTRSMTYISRGKMSQELKTGQEYQIYKNNGLLVDYWMFETARNTLLAGTDVMNYTIYLESNLNFSSVPNKDLELYFCNSTYIDDRCTADGTGYDCTTNPDDDTDNCVYLTVVTTTDLATRDYVDRNSSYWEHDIGVSEGLVGGIRVSNHSYIYYVSDATAVTGYFTMRYANGSTGTNISFSNSNVSWSTTDAGTNFITAAWTPDTWMGFTKNNTWFQMGVYCEDTSPRQNNYTNFLLLNDFIGDANLPISTPNINAFMQGIVNIGDATDDEDTDLNGTYYANMTIHINIATDPDSPGTVEHNLTLHSSVNFSVAHVINASFYSPDDSDLHVFFDTNVVPDGNYHMGVCAVADDDLSNVECHHNDVNFSIDNAAPVQPNCTFPYNITYESIVDIPLRCSVTHGNISMWYYSLDGADNVTIENCSYCIFYPNTTIFNVINGYHNVTVWVNKSNGLASSTEMYFSVNYTGLLYEVEGIGGPFMETNVFILFNVIAFSLAILSITLIPKGDVRAFTSLLSMVIFWALALWSQDLSQISGGTSVSYEIPGLLWFYAGLGFIMFMYALVNFIFMTVEPSKDPYGTDITDGGYGIFQNEGFLRKKDKRYDK